jgi:hypothetical protein
MFEKSISFNEDYERKILKVLTIDFDVFFNFPLYYPSQQKADYDWCYCYSCHADAMKHMTFWEKEYQKIKDLLHHYDKMIYVSENHQFVYDYLMTHHRERKFHLTNLDHHADIGNRFNPVSCGNWVSYLYYANYLSVYEWRYLTDRSVDCFCDLPVIACQGIENLGDDWDLIFLIQSAAWSPSHMMHKFRELYEGQPNIEIDKRYPLEFLTYKEQTERLILCNILTESVQYAHENDDTSIIYYVDGDEDDLCRIYKNPRKEILELLGECDTKYC